MIQPMLNRIRIAAVLLGLAALQKHGMGRICSPADG